MRAMTKRSSRGCAVWWSAVNSKRITRSEVESIISRAVIGRYMGYTPVKGKLFTDEDGYAHRGLRKPFCCACVVGAIIAGCGLADDLIRSIDPLFTNETTEKWIIIVLSKLGIDPNIEVRDIQGNREQLYKAIWHSYDMSGETDESWAEWMRSLPEQGL